MKKKFLQGKSAKERLFRVFLAIFNSFYNLLSLLVVKIIYYFKNLNIFYKTA